MFRYHEIYNAIKGNPKRLIEIQDAVKVDGKSVDTEDEKSEKTGIQIDERLKKILLKREMVPDDDWLIERFIHLTESTVVRKSDKSRTAGYARSFKQGEAVLIPKGIFLYGEDTIEKDIDYDYKIDVYPVTNKQYKEFVDETNCDVPHSDNADAKPYSWDKNKRTYPEGMGDHPVVLVSYDDAIAFCKWRSEKEGIEVRLPTEEEWDKAARGRDGREYPRGNVFDFTKLNCADYHMKKVLKGYEDWEKEFINGFNKRTRRGH
ncbi:MAG: formylglycine-generating enzyme family protein [Candidatus Scalindua sp.]|nr:formylglycine-generating enzyme family protein [Candidatus Scalindua sp.]